jgi:hypothetical protein
MTAEAAYEAARVMQRLAHARLIAAKGTAEQQGNHAVEILRLTRELAEAKAQRRKAFIAFMEEEQDQRDKERRSKHEG